MLKLPLWRSGERRRSSLFAFPRQIFSFLFLLVLSSVWVQAQPQNTPQREAIRQKMTTMQDILQSISLLEEELVLKETEYNEVETEEGRKVISEELKGIHERLENLDKDFIILSTGIDKMAFFNDQQEELILEDEIQEIFSPLVYEMKEMTARPREIERLRGSIPYFERRVAQMDEALANIDTLRQNAANEEIKNRLQELEEFWSGHRLEQKTELETMQLQLDNLSKQKKTFGEAIDEVTGIFFRGRGKNLLLALLIFALTFVLLRYLHKLIYRFIKLKRVQERQLIMRFVDIFYYAFTVIASIGLFLTVLYLSSDWILLGLAIILLLGIIWASKNALPRFLNQAQLLINLGPVREGERLVYKGVPWLVQSLNIYTELVNPELESGYLRLPVQDLVGLRSRPFSENESWFPTSKGDWIKLSDGFYGKIVQQTPELVTIDTQRGSYKNYQITDFLGFNPQNLSRNTFSVNRTVEIAHKYRYRVNTEIAPAVKTYLEDTLRKESFGDLIILVIVELKEINPSSLGLICILKFKGDYASEYFETGWKIEQVVLDALNELNIDIPYPQLTIHDRNDSWISSTPSDFR